MHGKISSSLVKEREDAVATVKKVRKINCFVEFCFSLSRGGISEMAGNAWINGYLEAILDSGSAAITAEEGNPQRWAAEELKEEGSGGAVVHFNPTRYFVEEVVTGVDETDLHRTWIKVVATRNTRERSSRLENMCWRIWHLTRKKKQVLFLSLSLLPSFFSL